MPKFKTELLIRYEGQRITNFEHFFGSSIQYFGITSTHAKQITVTSVAFSATHFLDFEY